MRIFIFLILVCVAWSVRAADAGPGNGIAPAARRQRNYTPEQLAVIKSLDDHQRRTGYGAGLEAIKKAVLQHGISIFDACCLTQYHRNSIMQEAVLNNEVSFIAALVQNKVLINGPIEQLKTAMKCDVLSLPMARLLLQDPQATSCSRLLFCSTDNFVKIPHLALLFFKAGADPRAVDSFNATPLMHHAESVNALAHRPAHMQKLAEFLVGIGVPLDTRYGRQSSYHGSTCEEVLGCRFRRYDEGEINSLLEAIERAKKEFDQTQEDAQRCVDHYIPVTDLRDIVMGYSDRSCIPASIQVELDLLDRQELDEKMRAAGEGDAKESAAAAAVVANPASEVRVQKRKRRCVIS